MFTVLILMADHSAGDVGQSSPAEEARLGRLAIAARGAPRREPARRRACRAVGHLRDGGQRGIFLVLGGLLAYHRGFLLDLFDLPEQPVPLRAQGFELQLESIDLRLSVLNLAVEQV